MIEKHKINQWRNLGYLIESNIIDNKLVNDCNKYMNDLYENDILSVKDFGSEGKLEFPSNTILDKIMINEEIINIVKILLQTDDILLVQADAWGKKGHDNYNKDSNNDQRMHMDYGNNSFLHPSEWNNPECVGLIIYLSDIKETGGYTALVPKIKETEYLYEFPYKNMPGISDNKFYNNKKSAEEYFKKKDKDIYDFRNELYKNEIKPEPDIGDILFYRLDLWHRGTPVKKGKIRFVVNLLWKKKECFWINCWNSGWTKKMYYGEIEKLFTEMSPLQRSILGVPKAGDKYWNLDTINLLKMRYPEIDINPYLKELK